MTKLDAAAAAIKEAGYDQMAREFTRFPKYRARIAKIVSDDVRARLGTDLGDRLYRLLITAAQ